MSVLSLEACTKVWRDRVKAVGTLPTHFVFPSFNTPQILGCCFFFAKEALHLMKFTSRSQFIFYLSVFVCVYVCFLLIFFSDPDWLVSVYNVVSMKEENRQKKCFVYLGSNPRETQEDQKFKVIPSYEFEASLGYLRLCLKKEKEKGLFFILRQVSKCNSSWPRRIKGSTSLACLPSNRIKGVAHHAWQRMCKSVYFLAWY